MHKHENTPFRHRHDSISQVNPHAPHAVPHKRKLSDMSTLPASPSKKSKNDVPGVAQTNDDSELAYCHQCGKKREISTIIQCNYPNQHAIINNAQGTKQRRCIAKYCSLCLKKKYQEDIEQIRKRNAGNAYQCPKCRDICNCWKCRKQKGLLPLKNITQDANASSKPARSTPSGDKTKIEASRTCGDTGQVRPVRKPRAKPLPRLHWKKHPAGIPISEFEARVQIREFMMRFAPVMGANIAKSHLEELEYLNRAPFSDDDDEHTDGMLLPWVSEACLKSVILGLLGLLVEEEDSSAARVMKLAMKDIRGSGANLTKMFAVLADLRDKLGYPEEKSASSDDSESSEDRIIIEFPDPLPPPRISSSVRTRNAADSSLQVVSTAQLIPVVLGLIETVTESFTVRNEIEEGIKEGKEKTRETRDTIKNENDKWEGLKKHLEGLTEPEGDKPTEKLKIERQSHKATVQAIENALRVVMPSYAPRFAPLGTDDDGRVYWALTPSMQDRMHALQFLSLKSSGALQPKRAKTKKDKRKRDSEDVEFKEWSRFLAVFGKRPVGENISGDEADSDEWWVFAETEDIQKLSEWISMVYGSSTTVEETTSSASATPKSPHNERIDGLVKNIKDFANTLEWRIKGDD
ncbi:hypothetical protein K435DRAFT_966477 [Dendrothele bispora CBS 962.96]|uniref:Zinc-finger domain-containing protein n=1 Tax=Dendrothele bispora (strain CBS 962.96) TaxID=1314807 RepID=A0A4S8M0P7_DENBC|nr:hypothetical protein K435DRAFT_966477 [Dendrothele bispora CBS 962.96]